MNTADIIARRYRNPSDLFVAVAEHVDRIEELHIKSLIVPGNQHIEREIADEARRFAALIKPARTRLEAVK